MTSSAPNPPNISRFTYYRILLYGTMMFFVFFADHIMSYVAPVFITEKMNSAFLMGLILSSSSVFGLISDMVISKQFAQKEYRFFARWVLALAMFFPMLFLFLPAQPLPLLIAMAVWGVYYEFINFSQFNFIHRVVGMQHHTRAWGILEIFKSFGCFLGPIAATFLLRRSVNTAFYAVILCLIVGLVLFYFYRRWYPERVTIPTTRTFIPPHRSFIQELRIWVVLMKKIWPMYLFFFAFVLLEAGFWTIGPLLSEEIAENNTWSSFLISAYMLPSLFMPAIAHHFSSRFSKKRIAFTTALIGSILLATGTFFWGHSNWLIVIVFFSSIFFALDYPEIEAVFEDYLSRIDNYSNDLIGLQSTSTSLSYIVGPALAGGLASWFGNSNTLGVLALFLGAISLLLLFITPRKIKMPKQELHDLTVTHQP